ncbi:unnamed protein product [Urochloa decumbens]|uniref:Leucine-rich repeat-containing N-terminal plant-type domain-containing protein n=1 Tax=Urochloa decumbens TaxID=240449 RepID=A0ABC8W647_9POAL
MKMKTRGTFPTLLLAVASLLVAAAAAGDSKGHCHSGDKAALLAIKAALGNPYHFASWTPDDPCCDWYDIDCDDATGRVIGLSVFQDDNITGTIPDAISGLVHLQSLTWHHLPSLSGVIPPAIAKLSNLSMLTISWTAISGPVPTFLGALKKLTLLDLSFNSLSGTIPASLGGIPNLSGINLSRNRLTGGIPGNLLSKSADQIYLWLSHNNLSGTIPPEFAAANFAHLDLSRNALTGDASGFFGKGKELQYLDLSRNGFSFNFSGVGLPEQLYFVDVSHNAIYGGIPAEVADLDNLQFFNVSYNRLCGEVPTGGHMGRFDLFNFQHNKCLCGTPLPNPCK